MPKPLFVEEKIENPKEFFKSWVPTLTEYNRWSSPLMFRGEFEVFNYDSDKFMAKIIFSKNKWSTYFVNETFSTKGEGYKFNFYQATFLNLFLPLNPNNPDKKEDWKRKFKNAQTFLKIASPQEVKEAFTQTILFNDKKMLLADIFFEFVAPENDTKQEFDESRAFHIVNLLLEHKIDLFHTGLNQYLYSLLKNNSIDILARITEDYETEIIHDTMTLGQYFSYLSQGGFGKNEKIKTFLQKFALEEHTPQATLEKQAPKSTFKL